MSNLEKAYYDKCIELTAENKKLRLELEKHQKIDERAKDLQWRCFKYKKFFEPLAMQYGKAFDSYKILSTYFDKLLDIYNKFLLLNPSFNVKLSDADKNYIIKELQLILIDYKKLKPLKEYDIIRDLTISPKVPKPIKKEFERKNFVVKK